VKSYNQYCPIAHALDVVGERWSLLIVRELVEHDQLRYSDLHANLPHCGTNILAARLKDLERNGVVSKRRLPPPAASTVYELTEYGRELRPVLHVLAHWGARTLGPPTDETELEPGWLTGALQMIFLEPTSDGKVEFRVDDEVASIVDGEARDGPAESPDVVVSGDRAGFYHFVVDRDFTCVTVDGDADLARSLIASLPYPTESRAASATACPASYPARARRVERDLPQARRAHTGPEVAGAKGLALLPTSRLARRRWRRRS
jgi:DNA-binding HxlR family transcriptional regulator